MIGSSRRDILLTGTAFAAAALPAFAEAQAYFRHGVASGDPTHESVVLWTRVYTEAPRLSVRWQIALDPDFRQVVRSGRATAERSRDHTVKVIPRGLSAGATYHYRFLVDGQASPVGRTRTLPTGRLDRLGIALMSCANYTLGYFTTYDAVARDPSVDFVLHTGDYIYEYSNAMARQSPLYLRPAEPPHETVTLADYRRRHATHKSDPHSQAMHAAHPMIAIWDDHEVANDSWKDGAENHQASEGAWADRCAAALRAYYEWMPIRDPAAGGDPREGWGTYRFGDLATLVTLETRLSGRSKPLSLRGYKDRLAASGGREMLQRDLGDPKRQMLSRSMKEALQDSLAGSVRTGQFWRLIGNGVLMGRVATPNLRKHGIRPEDDPQLLLLDKYTDFIWSSDNEVVDGAGSWDGYGGARQAFYELCHRVGARDLVVLTGDSHSFWSNALYDDRGAPMGFEFGTAGVNVPSGFEMARIRAPLIQAIDRLSAACNAEVRWTDSQNRGYVRLVLERDAATVDFVSVETTRATGYGVSTLRRERLQRGPSGLTPSAESVAVAS
jgi:alkaline phosphatase D